MAKLQVRNSDNGESNMKYSVKRFDLWLKGIDVAFVGVEKAEAGVRKEVLCPYGQDKLKDALSFEGTKKRIKVIDSVVSKCLRL